MLVWVWVWVEVCIYCLLLMKVACWEQDVWHIAWAAAVFERLTVEDVTLLAGKHTDMQIANYPSLALQGIAEVARCASFSTTRPMRIRAWDRHPVHNMWPSCLTMQQALEPHPL